MGVQETLVAFLLFVCRTSSLAPPSYTSDWLKLDVEGKDGAREYKLQHMLGELPLKVDIQVDPDEGDNKGYYFYGIGSAQTATSEVSKEIGGVIYVYNDTFILVKCPNKDVGEGKAHVVYTGSSSDWINKNSQKSMRAKFRVRAWKTSDFPTPNYDSGWLPISVLDPSLTQLEVETYSDAIRRKYVIVRVRITDGGQLQGVVCDAQGSSMAHTGGSHWGGVVYRVTESVFDIWAPTYVSNRAAGYGSLCNLNGGWGEGDTGYGNEGEVQIQIFDRLGAEEKFSIVIHALNVNDLDNNNGFNYDSSMDADMDYDLVDAKLQDEDTSAGFRLWPATGGVLFPESYGSKYGGVVFAYRSTSVRVWIPFYDPLFYVDEKWGLESGSVTATGAGLILKVYKVSQCEGPSSISNAWYIISGSAPYYYGTTVTYTCNEGYFHVSGQLVRQCDHFDWDGTEPVCDITTTPTSTSSTTITTSPTIKITQTSTTTTQSPKTTTHAPETTTQAPITTTQVPITTTQAQETTTQAQETTTQVPITTTQAQETTTQAPITTTQAQETTTQAPITTTQAQETTTQVPITTTQAPVTTTQAQVTTTQTPVTTTQAPITTTQAPITTTQSPVTTTDIPVTTTQSPMTTHISNVNITTNRVSAPNVSTTGSVTIPSGPATEQTTGVTTVTTQTTTTFNTTVSEPQYNCWCNQTYTDSVSSANISEVVAALQDALRVDKSQTSKTIRSKTSAEDTRPVSKYVGLVGLTVLIAELSIFVVIDISNICKRGV